MCLHQKSYTDLIGVSSEPSNLFTKTSAKVDDTVYHAEQSRVPQYLQLRGPQRFIPDRDASPKGKGPGHLFIPDTGVRFQLVGVLCALGSAHLESYSAHWQAPQVLRSHTLRGGTCSSVQNPHSQRLPKTGRVPALVAMRSHTRNQRCQAPKARPFPHFPRSLLPRVTER